MREITTGQLTDILMSHGPSNIDEYHYKYLKHLPEYDFAKYMSILITDKGIAKSAVVNNSGIEIHYGYQILNGTKRPGRDKIICLCIGAGCGLKEIQRVLKITGKGSLYPKRTRDAVIMLAINKGVNAVWGVNADLAQHDQLLLA